MGHIIKFSQSEKSWYAANWAAEHVVRLVLRFLPSDASTSLREGLAGMGTVTWDLDFSGNPASEMRHLLAAAESAFEALTKAGPGTEFFADCDFYPGFVDRFREFVEMLRNDERVAIRAA